MCKQKKAGVHWKSRTHKSCVHILGCTTKKIKKSSSSAPRAPAPPMMHAPPARHPVDRGAVRGPQARRPKPMREPNPRAPRTRNTRTARCTLDRTQRMARHL